MLDVNNLLQEELDYLKDYENNSISVSTTSKGATLFNILPRRGYLQAAMSSFMINDINLLEQVLFFFDGKVESIYVDVEQKQEINLYRIAKELVTKSKLVTVKPNDVTLESCDLLIRNHFNDDLHMQKIIVVGTGNLASRIAVRLAERQAEVYIKGRTLDKERKIVDSLNLFLPKHTHSIKSFHEFSSEDSASLVVSFLSGQFLEESVLHPIISDKTLIVDAGINNFSQSFIKTILEQSIQIFRLDTRIALPYQFMISDDYVQGFFANILGMSELEGVEIASGGFIGTEGTVIVNNIKSPTQVIGIADGSGGVKSNEQLNAADRQRIQTIKQSISKSS